MMHLRCSAFATTKVQALILYLEEIQKCTSRELGKILDARVLGLYCISVFPNLWGASLKEALTLAGCGNI